MIHGSAVKLLREKNKSTEQNGTKEMRQHLHHLQYNSNKSFETVQTKIKLKYSHSWGASLNP